MKCHNAFSFTNLCLIILILCTFCIGYTKASPSGKFENEASVVAEIKDIQASHSLFPEDKIQELNTLVGLSVTENWKEAEAEARLGISHQYVMLGYPKGALEQLQVLDSIIEQLNNETLTTRYMTGRLSAEDLAGTTKNAVSKQRAILARVENIEDLREKANVYFTVGYSQYDAIQDAAAIQSFTKAYEIFQQVGDLYGASAVYSALGATYIRISDAEFAIEYFKKSLEVSTQFNNRFDMSIDLHNLGQAYYELGKYELAKQTVTESLTIREDIDDKVGIMMSSRMLADIAVSQEEWKTAFDYYRDVELIARDTESPVYMFDILTGLALSSIALGNLDYAQGKIDEIEDLIGDSNQNRMLAYFYELKSKLLAANDNFEQAYEFRAKSGEMRKDEFEQLQREQVQKYRVQFDLEIKETQNSALIKENELKELLLTEQESRLKAWTFTSVLVALLLILVAYLLFKQTRHRNRFKSMALKDHLTDSPNRRAIMQIASERYQECIITKSALTLLLVDLDKFKDINDTYGHKVGDDLLRCFASSCEKALRKQDKFGRYGGEEWLICLVDTDDDFVHNLFLRLRQTYQQSMPAEIKSNHALTFSMGAAMLNPDEDSSIDILISRADTNLYKAKQNGRDCVVV